MLPLGEPRWRRRKEARPGEIVAAALAVFAEKGLAAARLDDIAARAGSARARSISTSRPSRTCSPRWCATRSA